VELSNLRSLLFAPGNEERKLRKALASAADAVVADLEDAVVSDRKQEGREVVARVFGEAGSGPARLVRINAPGTEGFADDLILVASLALDAVVLPKATPEAVAELPVDGPPVLAIVETAYGLRSAYETARSPRVQALALGAADLAVELRLQPRPDGLELLYARSQLVLDSAAAGLRAPFDVVRFDFRDAEGLEAECLLARSLGFLGKLCIHPDQVGVVNRVFAATEAELEWARRVLEAYEAGLAEGRGAVALDGVMIDMPIVKQARSLLAQGGERGN
jgi:citrate lyase beta subunit